MREKEGFIDAMILGPSECPDCLDEAENARFDEYVESLTEEECQFELGMSKAEMKVWQKAAGT